MNMKRRGFYMRAVALPALALAVIIVSGAVAAGTVGAAAAAPTAQQVLDSMQMSGLLGGSGRAVVELVVEKGKQTKTNKVEIFRRDDGKGSSSQMVEFLAPADVKGTKFLSIVEPGAEDQMWLYLPAVGRERRIAGSSAQGQFMGTDFTFEEISLSEDSWKDYTAALLPDQKVDGRLCYVLRLTPKSSGQAYTGVVLYVWQDGALPLKIEFYGKGDKLQKVMTLQDLQKVEGGIWQPRTIKLTNVTAGSATTVKILESDTKPVSDEVFTLRYLRK